MSPHYQKHASKYIGYTKWPLDVNLLLYLNVSLLFHNVERLWGKMVLWINIDFKSNDFSHLYLLVHIFTFFCNRFF